MLESNSQFRTVYEKQPLNPLEPNQLWTFECAVSLLKQCDDDLLCDALHRFLTLNKSVFLSPVPFSNKSSSNVDVSKLKELPLRGITYPNITESNKSDASEVSETLNLDIHEVLRIISLANFRIPQRKLSVNTKSNFPDDREIKMNQHKIQFYTRKVLRERRTVLELILLLLHNKTNHAHSTIVQNLGKEIYISKSFVPELILNLENLFKDVLKQETDSGIPEELAELILSENILFIVDSLKLLTELLVGNPDIEKRDISSWFKLMEVINFGFLNTNKIMIESSKLIQALCSIVSLLFLDLDSNYGNLADVSSYMNDPNTFQNINNSLRNTACDPIVMYAWSFVLYRKSVILESFPTNPETKEFLKIFDNNLDILANTINEFTRRCSEMRVFEALRGCHFTLKFDSLFTAILSSFLLAVIPMVSLNLEISSTISYILSDAPDYVVANFFNSEATQNLIIVSRTKFPSLLLPYIKLANVNGVFALNEFNQLRSYSVLYNRNDFEAICEIDNMDPDLVRITKSIDIFPPYENGKKLSLFLKKGTRAKVLPTEDKDEILVAFLYNYNGWSLLGRILQNISKTFDDDEEKEEFVVEIFNLLSKIVKDTNKNQTEEVLGFMSTYTDDSDIVEIILRLFEQALHSRDLPILKSGLNLLTCLTSILSYRIWPHLSKSALLSQKGKDGFISVILGAIEMVNGDYSFTVALIKLVDSLTRDCLSLHEDFPLKAKGDILGKFVNHLIQIFESFIHWRFAQAYQKMEIGVLILDVFSTILITVYGIDEDNKAEDKPTKVFASSANQIIDAFLVSDLKDLRSTKPLISLIDSVSTSLLSFETRDLSGFWHNNWIKSVFSFSQLIVSARSVLSFSPSTFEEQLFTKLPSLVDIYSQNESLRKNVLDLVTTLVNGTWPDEPPSLLAHLGSYHSQILLHSLAADLENTFDHHRMKVSLYDFLSAVMDGNQEGLSILFISGKNAFTSLGVEKENDNRESDQQVSLLKILKKNVKKINSYPDSVALHLVDSISLAFNSWATARESSNDVEFINELIRRIQFNISTEPKSTDDYITLCYEYKLISKIAEILALYLFTAQNEECKKNIATLLTDPSFLEKVEKCFRIIGYRPSLHGNLHKNFEKKWPNLKLSQFSKSPLINRNRFGVGAIYSLILMDQLLQDNDYWEGYREEIILASVNLQYVSAQMATAKSLGALITAFCKRAKDPIDPKFLKTVSHLLKISCEEGVPAPIFNEIYQERVELAFYITYSISKTCPKPESSDVFGIIKAGSELLVSPDLNFIGNLNDNAVEFYRPLLRTLLTTLRMTENETKLFTEYSSIFTDIFTLVVAKGAKYLFNSIQNEVFTSHKHDFTNSNEMGQKLEDILLILSILKAFTQMNVPSNFKIIMSSVLVDNGTLRAILNLYSCSHSIRINDEPIFADITLMFIHELVSIEVIAEQLISGGLFSTLVESPISGEIQKGGIRVTNSPRLHHIWSNGLLSIILTLLSKFNAKLLPEICMFLTYFSKQIATATYGWSQDSVIVTIPYIHETGQLILLHKVLKALQVEDYMTTSIIRPTIVGINTQNNSEIQVLPGLDTEEQRAALVESFNHLLTHPKFLASRTAPSTIEEQRIFDRDGKDFRKFVDNLVVEIADLKESIAK